ncbi:hypothetical protein ScPMuIL_018158 [Solemya velum]
MLHEVLLALSGHSGGLFRENGGCIEVLGDVPFIQPSEIAILNRLCKLGTSYRLFANFIEQHGQTLSLQHDDSERKEDIHGLYLKTFCHGLEKLLEDYRQVLLSLETSILMDPHLPLSHLVRTLQEYERLFPALTSVIEQIKSHKAHGCYILDILHKNGMSGLPIVRDSLNRILHVCHGVLFRQLCSWLLHGSLYDPYKEFFIQRQIGDSPAIILDTEDFDDDLGIMGVTGRQLQKQLSMSPATSSAASHQFCLKADLLPTYIPVRVANKILFVGESIQMFETDRKSSSLHRGSILKNQEEKFAKDLHELSKQTEFNGMAFEALIDKIRTHVAEHLWMLVVDDAALIAHLKIIKDFYLLGRGELYLAFIDQAQNLLRSPPTGTTEHDINMAYQQAARNVLFNDETLLQRFKLTITTKTIERNSSGSSSSSGQSTMVESGWNCLGLAYSVQWPLHIFFTTKSLEKYNRIFRFLLAVRRTQLDLQQCWGLHMHRKNKTINQEDAATWQLRTHMTFLVDNLQYYLQVDVIESQYGILLEKINTTRDFEAVKLGHDQFLSALLAQSFVHMKSVSHCLSEILDQCTSFCKLVMTMDTSNSSLADREVQQLETITKNFRRQSNLLFKILSSVRSHNASPHLAQLLLRLDFNKYFTISGGQLGSY